MIPALNQGPRGVGVWLLDEPLDRGRWQVGMQPRADLDVAIARGGVRRGNAEHHQVAALGGTHRLLKRRPEGLLVGDEMISRQSEADLVRISAGDHAREPDRDGR